MNQHMIFHAFTTPTSHRALIAGKHFHIVLLYHVVLQVPLRRRQFPTGFTLMPDALVNNIDMCLYLCLRCLGYVATLLWTLELDSLVISLDVSTQRLPALLPDIANVTNVIQKCFSFFSFDVIYLLGRELDALMLVFILFMFIHLRT